MKYIMLLLLCVSPFANAITAKELVKSTGMKKQTATNVVNAIACGKRFNRQSPDVMMVADMNLASYQKRFFAIDMKTGKLLINDYVTHGRGSDPDRTGVPSLFSNEPNSMQTSLGLYRVSEDYYSEKMAKEARKLDGLMIGWNNNARIRGVVFHPANYVASGYVGRSEGCPAVRQGVFDALEEHGLDNAMLWVDGPEEGLAEDVASCAASAKYMRYQAPPKEEPKPLVGTICRDTYTFDFKLKPSTFDWGMA
ncbi:murein L,D-transpeptidase catalytic domain-containing protein [Pseudoxanthomonas winnipegensis]|nr:murein L,D-transpeptidase catalytic domain family protein [Pseudoxanthomonas winnipegensis]